MTVTFLTLEHTLLHSSLRYFDSLTASVPSLRCLRKRQRHLSFMLSGMIGALPIHYRLFVSASTRLCLFGSQRAYCVGRLLFLFRRSSLCTSITRIQYFITAVPVPDRRPFFLGVYRCG
jgi:hypothetical protein